MKRKYFTIEHWIHTKPWSLRRTSVVMEDCSAERWIVMCRTSIIFFGSLLLCHRQRHCCHGVGWKIRSIKILRPRRKKQTLVFRR